MPDTDATPPNPARNYDWLLDGTQHAAIDRAAGGRCSTSSPTPSR